MKKALLLLLILCLLPIVSAGNDEVFIQGVVRNATNNNLTEFNTDINLSVFNGTTQIFSQVQSSQSINDGVYHTTFTGIMHDWFLYALNFSVKLGSTLFTQQEIVPVPLAHASFISNDTRFVNGVTAADILTISDTASNWNLANTTAWWATSGAWNLANHTAAGGAPSTGDWQLANFSSAYSSAGNWNKANYSAAHVGEWELANTSAWWATSGNYGNTNWTANYAAGGWDTGNMSITYYAPTQSAAITGTINGFLANITHNDGNVDGVTLNVTEAAGTPALDVRMNFTSITEFTEGVMRYYTSSITGSYPLVQLWNYDDSVWDNYPSVAESLTFTVISDSIYYDDKYISGGVVQMRLYKASVGNTNNIYYIDWVAIAKGFGVPAGNEVDPNSIHTHAINNTQLYYQDILNINKTWLENLFVTDTESWKLANFSTAFSNSGYWNKANYSAAHVGEWMLANTTSWWATSGYYTLTNFSAHYQVAGGYNNNNLTTDYPNLDNNSSDDHNKTSNLNLTSYNITTNYPFGIKFNSSCVIINGSTAELHIC